MSTDSIVQVPFNGQIIEAQKTDEGIFVALKPLCENLGIDYSGQLKRLKKQQWATMDVTPTVAADGKTRYMFMIDRKTFVMWLATIDASRLSDGQVKSTVYKYQNEAAYALDSYFNVGIAATPATIDSIIADPASGIKLLQALQVERQEKDKARATIESQKPKVLFADSVETSSNSVLVGELARDLRQNGVDTGQNRLYEWLRNHGYLISRRGEHWNEPQQRYVERGLFEVKTRVINNADGTVAVKRTTKVTGKGRLYFTNKFLGGHTATPLAIDDGDPEGIK